MVPYCDGCQRSFEPDEKVYRCLDCVDFDFCPACFHTQGAAHDHLMAQIEVADFQTWWL